MLPEHITHTQQLNWNYYTHCYGACATAAKKILNGDIVRFYVYNRDDKNDSTKLKYKGCFYFGLSEIEGNKALRVNSIPDIQGQNSHSLIPSWYDEANDPVFISARLVLFLMREGSDWFTELY